MAKSNSWQDDLLLLLFQNSTLANYGNTAGILGSSVAGSLYVALHTADPTAAGTQSSNEVTYTSYARVAVARTSAGWTISGSSPTQVTNTALISFPQCTGGTNTITFFSVGIQSSGATKILYSGAVTPSLAVSNGITPQINASTLVITES